MNRLQDRLWDGLLALLLIAIGLVGTAPAAEHQDATIGAWAYVFAVAAAVAVAFRRLLPTTVLAVTAATTGLYLLSGFPPGPIVFSVAVSLYTMAAHRPLRRAAVAAGAVLLVLAACGWFGADYGLGVVAPVVAWVAAPLAVGVTVRVSREQARQSRRDDARRQADAERLRVAQEVHDVVGHGLAAINMQAEIALHLLARQPSNAEAALTAISRTSRESLDELRATLGAVRRGDDLDDRAPVAGLARLDALVDRTRAVGVPVSVTLAGPLAELPAAVDLAAYRIVQESLTNVLRHAGTATAEVTLSYVDGVVTVLVTDSGLGGGRGKAAGATDGHGLAGMRERVAALGGTLTAGPRPGGGFVVTATIPVSP
jgi:signal transduction histidine kinase